MINSNKLLDLFLRHNIDFFTGVPDSVLKNFTISFELHALLNDIRFCYYK